MRIALIGLGEVGRVFAEALDHDVVAWDIAFDDATSRAARNASELEIARAAGAADAVGGADVAICAVTAANDLAAATASAPGLIAAGTWFFDLNSASPGQKQDASDVVEAAGGRYVEAALMSAIGPRRLASPFLLGGPHAEAFLPVAAQLGLTDASVFSDVVGRAAATKLCRSVVVKGMETLLTESLTAARRYGVEREVLESLSNILPPADWAAVAAYFVSRSLEHGARRAEEMDEAAATVAQAGIDPLMARATAGRQRWAADRADAVDSDLLTMIDRLLADIPDPRSAQ